MRVFVTGASGHIGALVVPELLEAGHQVVGLARSDRSAAALAAAGAAVPPGPRGGFLSPKRGASASDGGHHLAVRHHAEVIGRYLNVPAVSVSQEEATAHFGFLGALVSLDIPTSSAETQERFGWRPVHPGLIADLDEGHYFATQSA